MELSLIGLQNAGKSSLVNVIATGAFQQDMIPTVGFNMRKVTKGAVTIKLWDLGGQVYPVSCSLPEEHRLSRLNRRQRPNPCTIQFRGLSGSRCLSTFCSLLM